MITIFAVLRTVARKRLNNLLSRIHYSRGRQPLGLVAQNREEEMSELFKIFTFVFFSDLGSTWSKKNEEKKIFRIGQHFRLSDFQTFRFQTFRLSVKICGKQNSKTIENFNIRPGEEKFCWDSAECSRHRCRPPPMPPLPPSPQKRVFSPQFSTSNSSEVSEFFEIVPGGKMFPWYLKINFYYVSQPSPALPGRGRARRTRGPDFCPAPLISPKISKIATWNRGYKSFIRVWDVIRYMGVDPLRSPPCPLGGKEGKSPTSFGTESKNCNISESFKFLDYNFSDIRPRAKTVRLLCFLRGAWIAETIPNITPFESTLVNWKVMSSILSNDRMKKSHFLRKFHLFRL